MSDRPIDPWCLPGIGNAIKFGFDLSKGVVDTIKPAVYGLGNVLPRKK